MARLKGIETYNINTVAIENKVINVLQVEHILIDKIIYWMHTL